jgi:hypothetical protein
MYFGLVSLYLLFFFPFLLGPSVVSSSGVLHLQTKYINALMQAQKGVNYCTGLCLMFHYISNKYTDAFTPILIITRAFTILSNNYKDAQLQMIDVPLGCVALEVLSWGVVSPGVPSILGCRLSWGVVRPWVLSILGCRPSWGAVRPGVPSILGCCSSWSAIVEVLHLCTKPIPGCQKLSIKAQN